MSEPTIRELLKEAAEHPLTWYGLIERAVSGLAQKVEALELEMALTRWFAELEVSDSPVTGAVRRMATASTTMGSPSVVVAELTPARTQPYWPSDPPATGIFPAVPSCGCLDTHPVVTVRSVCSGCRSPWYAETVVPGVDPTIST